MIGGRAFGLQQGPYGDIVNAVGAAAGDEGDANDHKAYRRETDQQHGRAHDRGGSERSQADPAADDPFGQGRADQHSGGPQSGQHAERGRAAFQGHDDKEHKGDIGDGGRKHFKTERAGHHRHAFAARAVHGGDVAQHSARDDRIGLGDERAVGEQIGLRRVAAGRGPVGVRVGRRHGWDLLRSVVSLLSRASRCGRAARVG